MSAAARRRIALALRAAWCVALLVVAALLVTGRIGVTPSGDHRALAIAAAIAHVAIAAAVAARPRLGRWLSLPVILACSIADGRLLLHGDASGCPGLVLAGLGAAYLVGDRAGVSGP